MATQSHSRATTGRAQTHTFTDDFFEAIAKVEADAAELGLNMSVICRDIGISRSTPARWRNDAPETIQIVTKMQEYIADKKGAAAVA